MNKTITIALAGFSFTIEEHAYIKLSDYLNALRNTLPQEEADEVMYDIESRIVEIFRESLGKREVIYDADVEHVIALIGKPEQIEEQEETYSNTANPKVAKQLFRDPERKKIAGVCAGLAAYFGMEITIMRLIWVVLFLCLYALPYSNPGFLLLIYGLLWLILPKAVTASDFLKMRGEPLNFDNLKNESSKIAKIATDSSRRITEIYNDKRQVITETGNSFTNILRYLLGSFLGVFSLILFFAAFAIFTAFFTTSHVSVPGYLGFIFLDGPIKYPTLISAFLTPLIPALILLFLTIKLFSPKTQLKYVTYIIGVLGFIWIILAIYLGISFSEHTLAYSSENEETENIAINTPSDSLWIGTNKVAIPSNFKQRWGSIYTDDKTSVYFESYPYVYVTTTQKDVAPYLIVKKEASGYNQPIKMKIPIKIEDNKILLPNYISYGYQDRKRLHKVKYELVVPERYRVLKIDHSDLRIIQKNKNEKHDDDQDDDDTSVSININGNQIETSSDGDSVSINGKKYSSDEADKVWEQLAPSKKEEIKNISIKINKNNKK
ncbi:PspC domain-containing protein [Riemerella columbina]|uniref:PspC domain-containing protein n=1 Tax=Riemerella columbina TaxID=103810 RepID=UPI00266F1CE3|nr:PspC domain-containing protein [Riemerella columbina]WKS95787.1 PspC domain-containing protein [Riemerella columbina]